MYFNLDLKFHRLRNSAWFLLIVLALMLTNSVKEFMELGVWSLLITFPLLVILFLSNAFRRIKNNGEEQFEVTWGAYSFHFPEFQFSKANILAFKIDQNQRKYYQIKVLLSNGNVHTLFTHPNKKPTLEKFEEIKTFLDYKV